MKKTVLLLVIGLMASACAQQVKPADNPDNIPAPTGTMPTTKTFPIVRVEAPNEVDLACAGFVTRQLLPNTNYVSGGLYTPNTTKYANGDIIYLTGKYDLGQQYQIVRELQDPNRFELYPGQFGMLKQMGQPYSTVGVVRIVDVRSKDAIGQVEFSCEHIVPGDYVVKYQKPDLLPAHQPFQFDRFLPANGKTSGRIVMAKDFDGYLGTGSKVYMNVGANQGVKAGEYFRAFRGYEADLHDPTDSLSFKASATEDTQKKPAAMEANFLTKTGGPVIRVRDLPRRAVGEVLILSTTPTTSTGMIVFALEDVHIGDGVELDSIN
ncbi:MAG TPA: hypothetical protein VF753_05180 [Terriglobales bacterium]